MPCAADPPSPTTPAADEDIAPADTAPAEKTASELAAEALRALLRLMLQLACNGVQWTDPMLGTPVGEHVTAEAIDLHVDVMTKGG